MPFLASIADFSAAIRFDSIDDVTPSLEAAMEAATSDIEGRIRTDLARATRYDIFLLTHRLVNDNIADLYEYHWKLTQGFLTNDVITVRLGNSISDLTAVGAPTVTTNLATDLKKGLISYVGGQLTLGSSGTTSAPAVLVRVDYTAGFEDTDEDGVYDGVPDWMSQAAIIRATTHLDTIQPNLRRNNSKQTRVQPDLELNVMEAQYNSLLQKHIRYFPKYANPFVKS
jgi:hypothetical protein